MFGNKIKDETNTEQCSECGEFYPKKEIKELCEHLHLCNPCYVKLFGSLEYEFVIDRDEFFSEPGIGKSIENVFVYVKGRRKDIERVLEILSNKLQFEKYPKKCYIEMQYRYYAANIFKVRHYQIPWTSDYMEYRTRMYRTLNITLEGPLGQVKPMNNRVIADLGEPFEVKGPSLIQKLRGYRSLK